MIMELVNALSPTSGATITNLASTIAKMMICPPVALSDLPVSANKLLFGIRMLGCVLPSTVARTTIRSLLLLEKLLIATAKISLPGTLQTRSAKSTVPRLEIKAQGKKYQIIHVDACRARFGILRSLTA